MSKSPLTVPPMDLPEFEHALIGQNVRTVTSEVCNVYDYEGCLATIMDTHNLPIDRAEEFLREEYCEKYFDQQSPIFLQVEG